MPAMCISWYLVRICGRFRATASFRLRAPRLPPMTITVGLEGSSPANAAPFSRLPLNRRSDNTGPTQDTFPFRETDCTVSGKVVKNVPTNGRLSLLASPGVMSDSCIKMRLRFTKPPTTTGNDTKPPLEKMMSGLILRTSQHACRQPSGIFAISRKFCQEK